MEKKIINTEKYKCFGFLNSTRNRHLQKCGIDCGYANGYVAIPPEHPLYVPYDYDVMTGKAENVMLDFNMKY